MTVSHWIRAIVAGFVAVISCNSSAQTYSLYQRFTNRNGLPQNEVTSICRDSRQYFWVGTQNGIARFDGRRFIVFNRSNSPALTSNRIYTLTPMGEDVLVTTEGSRWNCNVIRTRLSAIQSVTPGWNLLLRSFQGLTALGLEIKKVIADSSGELISTIQNKNVAAIRIKGSTETEGFFVLGNKFYYYHNAIAKYLGKAPQIKYKHIFYRHMCYFIDPQGKLNTIDTSGKSGKNASAAFIRFIEKIHYIHPDYNNFLVSEGHLFFHHAEQFYKINPESESNAVEQLLDKLPFPSVKCCYYNPDSKMLFIGTAEDGMFVYRPGVFANFQIPKTEEFSNVSNAFYGIVPYGNNGIFASQGVFDSNGNFQYRPRQGLNFNLLKTRAGKYVFLNGKKLFISNDFQAKGTILDSLYGDVSGLAESEDGWIYCATVYDVYRYKNGNRQTIYHRDESQTPLNAIFLDGSQLWIACRNELLQLNLLSMQMRTITGFGNQQVRTFKRLSPDYLLMGTYGDGWYIMSGEKIVKLPSDPNGFLNVVNGMIEDKAGYLWVSTNNGLFRFLTADIVRFYRDGIRPFYNFFDVRYGFESDEFNGGGSPSALMLANGKLVFPSIKGLLLFNPTDILPEEPTAPLSVDKIRLDGQELVLKESLELEQGFDEIAISVSCPYFGNSYNMQIEYGFAGKKSNWIPIEPDGIIRLTRLGMGEYNLVVRRPAGFGKPGFVEKRIHIVILPKWYQKRWFIVLLILLSICIGYIIFLGRINSLKWQKKQLDELVSASTKEIADQNAELQQRIEEVLRNKDALRESNLLNERLMSSLVHDIRSPLKFQLSATEALSRFLSGMPDQDLQRIAEELRHNTSGMYHFTGDIMSWHLSVNENETIEKTPTNLRDLCNKCIGFLQYSIAAHGNTFVNQIPAEVTANVQQPILEIVIRNLFDNSNKNTRNGVVTIDLQITSSNCAIVITDNGIGMRKDETENLNKFYRREKESSMPGFGSYMLRDFIQIIKAGIHYQSSSGVGTTTVLTCISASDILDSPEPETAD